MEKTVDKQNLIIAEFDEASKLYKNFANSIRQLLEVLLESEKIYCNAITCRVKDKESLIKKIEIKQGKYNSLKDITDIAGIRIITFYSDDVDKVAQLIEKEFEVDRDNTIDKRKAMEPDRFGYCSVHYIVGISANRLKLREYQSYKGLKCEIQIRTVLQHAWAEIEHDLGYKSSITIPQDIRRNFSRLAGLLEIADKEFLEIRNFLDSYVENAPSKIRDDEWNDKELDSIILSEFIKADEEIQRLNMEVAKIACTSIIVDETKFQYEDILRRLQWLDIRTLGRLKALVRNDGEVAKQIAELTFNRRSNLSEESLRISQTIGIFYLCYVELLRKFHDAEGIRRYFTDTRTEFDENAVSKFMEIQKELKL